MINFISNIVFRKHDKTNSGGKKNAPNKKVSHLDETDTRSSVVGRQRKGQRLSFSRTVTDCGLSVKVSPECWVRKEARDKHVYVLLHLLQGMCCSKIPPPTPPP